MPIWFVWERHEIFQWIEKGVALLDAGAVIEPALKARFLAWASAILWGQPIARGLAQQSLALSRGLGPEHQEIICWSLWVMAVGGFYMELLPEYWDEAEALLDEQSPIIARLGAEAVIDPHLYQGYNLWLRAVLANYRGQLERAREYGLESLRLFERWGNDFHQVSPNIALGDTALRRGDYEQALRYFSEAFRQAVHWWDARQGDTKVLLCETEYRRGNLAQAYGHLRDYLPISGGTVLAERLEMAARIFARHGRPLEAARLSGAAEAISEASNEFSARPTSDKVWGRDSYWGDWRIRFADVSLDALVPNWRDRPDGEAIQQAWNAGRAMSEQEAKDYALGLTI
jgi:tetratricopeptide (TPR) repeat protein